MTALRAMFADAAAQSMREAQRCASEAIQLEYDGAGNSYDCHHWWLGAVLHELWARLLGYRGPSLEAQLGRPPRPIKGRTYT